MSGLNQFTGRPSEAHGSEPDAATDDDLRDCPHCTASNVMAPQVKPSLVSEDNPQRYECVGCGYEEREN